MCAIYDMRFTRMNCLHWDMRTEMVQLNKMCVICGKQVRNCKRVRRLITTQIITANKPCVLWANDCWYTIVSDWWKHHRRVAPRLKATDLPCIASPEIMSSGNTQHIGTENNLFIVASRTEFILQQWSRPSGTLGAAEQYVHYLVNIKGPRLEQLRGSGITS